MPVYAKSDGKWLLRVWRDNRPYGRVFKGTREGALAAEEDFRAQLFREDGVERALTAFVAAATELAEAVRAARRR